MVAGGGGGAAPPAPSSRIPSPRRRRAALSPSKSHDTNSTTPPLLPSSSPALPRKPKSKPVPSRYLSSSSAAASSSSASTSTPTPINRRFASPLPAPRPSTPSAARSRSADKSRPAPPSAVSPSDAPCTSNSAAPPTTTTTRSLPVSFQGNSFSLATSKAKPAPSSSPSRRRPNIPTADKVKLPDSSQHHRWPSARLPVPSSLAKSVDCSLGSLGSYSGVGIASAVRSLRQSLLSDDGLRRASFDGGVDYLLSTSDTESASSGSNSDAGFGLKFGVSAMGVAVPGRLSHDSGSSRLRRLQEPTTPFLAQSPRATATSPRTMAVKKSLLYSGQSPLYARSSSPSKAAVSSPMIGMRKASPMRTRGGGGALCTLNCDHRNGVGFAIYGMDMEARRRKFGDSAAEDEHFLRLLYNRFLQWRFTNARADAALMAQKLAVEKYLCHAVIATSEMRNSVTLKRIELQLIRHHSKLRNILKGQMSYLEEWQQVGREHHSSLSRTVEALKASTLGLPIANGAKVDIQELKNSISSAVDVMQTVGTLICAFLSELAGSSTLLSELAKIARQERALMEQSRELLSTVAAMHVKYCSLQGQQVQLTRITQP